MSFRVAQDKSPELARTDEERQQLRREATRDLFDYLQWLTPSMGTLAKVQAGAGQQSERRELVQRALPRSASRLALLEQHEHAACVEYRFLAAALARQEGFGEAAGAVVAEDVAAASWSAMAGRVLKVTNVDWNIDDEIKGTMSEEEKKQLEQMKRALNDEEVPPFWLEQLAVLARRQGVIDALGFDFELNSFPLLLFSFCEGQGTFEPVAIYLIGRLSARLNVKRIALAEGKPAPVDSFELVARYEAELLEQDVGTIYTFVGGTGFLSILLFLWITWSIASALVGFIAPPPPDPLAF